MKVKISVELRNGAYRGNTMTKVITIDDEDLEGYTESGREDIISEQVSDAVFEAMVYWNWEEVTEELYQVTSKEASDGT